MRDAGSNKPNQARHVVVVARVVEGDGVVVGDAMAVADSGA